MGNSVYAWCPPPLKKPFKMNGAPIKKTEVDYRIRFPEQKTWVRATKAQYASAVDMGFEHTPPATTTNFKELLAQ